MTEEEIVSNIDSGCGSGAEDEGGHDVVVVVVVWQPLWHFYSIPVYHCYPWQIKYPICKAKDYPYIKYNLPSPPPPLLPHNHHHHY